MRMTREDQKWTVAACSAAVLALTIFALYRVRFVGGCDSASYLLESLRIRGVAPGLWIDPTIPIKSPLAPLCMVEKDGLVSSFFLPGFPVLLAMAGSLGLEFFLTPFLGAASGLALFCVARPRLGPQIALGAMIAWMASPLVFWGSTQVLSDFPAAAFAIFCMLALQRGYPVLAGALLGFSLGIRPSQALIAPALMLMAPKPRTQIRVMAGGALAVVAWAIFLRLSRGSLSLPYSMHFSDLDGRLWRQQLAFLLWGTLTLHLPVVILALVGLATRPRVVLPLVIWFCGFVVLHTLWRWPYDVWVWMRFMLPALPALFLAAAEGAAVIGTWLDPRRRALATIVGAILIAGYAGWTLFVSPARNLRVTSFDEHYARDAARVSQLVPAGSLVGAVTESGSLRLYSRFQSFFWCHSETYALLRWARSKGRPIYFVLDEPELDCNPAARALVARTGSTPLGALPSGKVLRRLDPPRDPKAPDDESVSLEGPSYLTHQSQRREAVRGVGVRHARRSWAGRRWRVPARRGPLEFAPYGDPRRHGELPGSEHATGGTCRRLSFGGRKRRLCRDLRPARRRHDFDRSDLPHRAGGRHENTRDCFRSPWRLPHDQDQPGQRRRLVFGG